MNRKARKKQYIEFMNSMRIGPGYINHGYFEYCRNDPMTDKIMKELPFLREWANPYARKAMPKVQETHEEHLAPHDGD